jgi:DNA-binding response OmpR family regulator
MVMIQEHAVISTAATERLLKGKRPIFILDTERDGLSAFCDSLEAYGCQVYTLSPDVDFNLLGSHLFATILGPGLPPLRVTDLCRKVRRSTDAPLFAFFQSPADEHLSMVLDAGADHCFIGPRDGAARLVLSAIAAIQRRTERASQLREGTIEAGDLNIDLERRTVLLRGYPVPLTGTEFSILTLLAQHAGQLLSPVEILKQIHGQEYEPSEARDIVKVHVSRLRQKLEADPVAARCIVNVRGQGYRYVFDRRAATEEKALAQLAVS